MWFFIINFFFKNKFYIIPLHAYEKAKEYLLFIHEKVLVDMTLTSAVFNEEQQCLATNISDHNLVEVSFIQSLLFQ